MASFSITATLVFLSCLFNLVAADPYIYGYSFGGVGGLIILVLDIIGIVDILRSPRPVVGKLLWILLILFFPIGGLIIWFLFGRKTANIV